MARHKRVLIIHTGGTIGMRPGPNGYVPVAGYLETYLKAIPELAHDAMPDVDVEEFDPLLDSSNMAPENWVKIARSIAEHYEEYDGFVILHGTDTMTYTTSALSFLLRNIDKPVIVTGSQIPIAELRTDGRGTLVTALLLAARFRIPEVCLFFHNHLFRGNRTVKVNAVGLDAFESPNFPVLAEVGIDIRVHWNRLLPMPQAELEVYQKVDATVGAMRLFPGISAAVVRNFLQPPMQGMVLETYGVGNAPQTREFLDALSEATGRGVVIVNCTQCLRGAVNMEAYATGESLREIGVVSGFDMTPAAALTKLAFLLSLPDVGPQDVRYLMQMNLRGELTPPSSGV